ncbi:MAG: dTDP-4-dehydrorhamnose 3,5-epimerase family protein [Candidatus Jacksonbacteria bacterium]
MIHDTYQNQIHKQNYSPKPKIEGVKIIDLPYFIDDGGVFCEIARILSDTGIQEYFPDFKLRQINWSQIQPGLIKAGHLHKKQEDIWFVPPIDRVLVGLIDARKGSATVNVKMRFVLGAGKARLLYIPRGVIHGCANPYSRPMTLIYLVNQYWTDDQKNTDEWRVDYQIFGKGFWEIAKG